MFCAKKSLFQITASVTIFIITTSRQVTLRNILSKSYHSVRKHRSSTIKMHKGVTYDHNHHPIDCLFCRIQIGKEPGTILYQDEDFVAFKTISPATDAAHLLIYRRESLFYAPPCSPALFFSSSAPPLCLCTGATVLLPKR